MGRGISSVVVLLAGAQVALAQPRSEAVPVLGAQAKLEVAASSGFVDDVVAADGDRVIYVIADGTTKAALHVATVGTTDEQIVDISTVTLRPTHVRIVGPRVFVAGIADGKQVAALIELEGKDKRKPAGTAIYKLGPADHITPLVRDGKLRVAVHRTAEKGGVTRHTTELVAIETGRRVAAGKPLQLDASGHDKKLDLRVNHWSDGFTRAHGIKAGEWDRKEDQRAPDQEATFDLVTGKVAKQKITDLMDQKRRYLALAEAGDGRLDFVRVAPNGADLELWVGGKPRTLELDQPFTNYDPKSLQGVIEAGGSGWLAFQVDPVNPDAVARKRADPEYLDIFKFAAGGKAVRKARVLAKKQRHRFGVVAGRADRFWLIERNAGFERGGKKLTLFQLQ